MNSGLVKATEFIEGSSHGVYIIYHVSLSGDSQTQSVDAAGCQHAEVRRQGGAGCDGHLTLEHTAGRQHRVQTALWVLQLIEHLVGDMTVKSLYPSAHRTPAEIIRSYNA